MRSWRNVSVLVPVAAVFLLLVSGLACQKSRPPRAAAGALPDPQPRSAARPDPVGDHLEPKEGNSGTVMSILDSRVQALVRAAEGWRQARGPERAVIDQVILVPDLPTFLEAISAWNERNFFPILFDDPAWTLPFLRAFRPARILRVGSKSGSRAGHESADQEIPHPRSLAESHDLWRAAERAVARAWTRDEVAETELPYAGRIPDGIGRTPPGLVFSNSESPMLAGAVALAAGRFQPLVWLDGVPSAPSPDDKVRNGPRIKPFHAVLSLSEARRLARMIESRVASIASPHGGLGDRCDFLTLAVDWPYRYQNDLEEGIARGEHALDDLIGRVLETEEGGLATSRSRWAFTGRLLGGPAASVYRAMCALFLHPDESLLWDTYTGAGVWTEYRMTEAAGVLGRLWPGVSRPLHRAGAAANLAAWHQALDPVSRFGWIMVNSSGGPRQFTISGGSGVPADLPRGRPAAVSMIQSFSAADPLDSSTIAGRWLANGAYVYFGSMNEPYLHAFRTPRLIAELAAAEVPLVAVLRQGESERFGRPWRLVYLGDPLYHFPSLKAQSRQNRAAPMSWRGRISAPVAGSAEVITSGLVRVDPSADPAARLQGCLTAAMAGLCQPDPGRGGDGRNSEAPSGPPPWLSVLTAIDRQTLAPSIRPFLDELVIDTLLCRGEQKPLLDWLGKIPPAECLPRVRDAFETTAMSRLSALGRDRSVAPLLDFWEQMLERARPAGSGFPAQLTARLAAMVESDPLRYREPYQKRLIQAAAELSEKPEQSPRATIIRSELNRLKITVQPAAGSP